MRSLYRDNSDARQPHCSGGVVEVLSASLLFIKKKKWTCSEQIPTAPIIATEGLAADYASSAPSLLPHSGVCVSAVDKKKIPLHCAQCVLLFLLPLLLLLQMRYSSDHDWLWDNARLFIWMTIISETDWMAEEDVDVIHWLNTQIKMLLNAFKLRVVSFRTLWFWGTLRLFSQRRKNLNFLLFAKDKSHRSDTFLLIEPYFLLKSGNMVACVSYLLPFWMFLFFSAIKFRIILLKSAYAIKRT